MDNKIEAKPLMPENELGGIKKGPSGTLLILFISLGMVFGLFYYYYQVFIPVGEGKEIIFTVKKGDGLNIIAANLEKEKLIKNKIFFVIYVFDKDSSGKLQAGDYLLSGTMNIPSIVKKISKGDALPREKSITFPEGLRVARMEEKLREQNFQFSLSVLKVKNFKEKYTFLKNVPENSDLEGFLFPDTYKLYPEATSSDLAEKMLDNFNEKLTDDLKNEIAKQGKSLYEIITMASIIEKEVKTFEDRQIVSGLFWKRIKNGIPLESCATIAYVLNDDKWRYTIQDTKIPSVYNTYMNRGLPPGPICNPGIDSIKAAIFPKDSPYSFFLTDPETGNTIFSKNFQEHNINKAKYLK